MSITTTACDSLYDQMCARASADKDANVRAVAQLQREMSRAGDTNRPNNGQRFQAQIIMTSGRRDSTSDACMLRVLNTTVYDRFLAFLLDARDGLEGIRSAKPHQSPLSLPDAMQRDDQLVVLNDVIAKCSTGETRSAPHSKLPCTAGQWAAFVARVLQNSDRLAMPATPVPVRVVRPTAAVGSLVLWSGWHGNTAALEHGLPGVAQFVDYAPRSTWTADQRRQSHAILCERPWEFGAGSLACRHAGFNARNNKAHGRAGGLSRLPEEERTPRAHWLAGDDDAAPTPVHLPPFLSADQQKTLLDQGYLVVPPAQLREHVPRWDSLIAGARRDMSEHLNDVLSLRLGDQLRKRPLDLDTAGDDERWAAVGGSQDDARRHFGDKFALYRPGATDARNGGSMITKQSGMGAATNLYDSPAQMQMQLELYPLFAQLYDNPDLLWVPERFRVRTSDGALPLHTDTTVRF